MLYVRNFSMEEYRTPFLQYLICTSTVPVLCPPTDKISFYKQVT